jgi:hypothetical protein
MGGQLVTCVTHSACLNTTPLHAGRAAAGFDVERKRPSVDAHERTAATWYGRGDGTFLEVMQPVMFGFTPPATPQTAPTPCPECNGLLAIALYATLRTEYFRCVQCHHVRSLTHDEPAAESHGESEHAAVV